MGRPTKVVAEKARIAVLIVAAVLAIALAMLEALAVEPGPPLPGSSAASQPGRQ